MWIWCLSLGLTVDRGLVRLLEMGGDLGGEVGAAVDPTGIDLDKGGAEGEFFGGVDGGGDSSDPDEGELVGGGLGEVPEDVVGFGFEGFTGEAAFLFGVGGVGEGVPGDGGVGGDESGELEVEGDFDDFVEGFRGEVGGDFDEEGFLAINFPEPPEDFVEVVSVLELAEAGGVGRADVDHEIVAVGEEFFEGVGVVFGGFFERGDF